MITDQPITITDHDGRRDFRSSLDAEVYASSCGFVGTLAELLAKAQAFDDIADTIHNDAMTDIDTIETAERRVRDYYAQAVDRDLGHADEPSREVRQAVGAA